MPESHVFRIEPKVGTFLTSRRKVLAQAYVNDANYKDSTTPLISLLLSRRSAFAGQTDRTLITVYAEDRSPLISAICFVAHRMPDVLQVAFFEAVPDCERAVDFFLTEVSALAQSMNLGRLVVGLDGHVNNGLGFLADGFDKPASFGSRYNPAYYIDYLEPRTTLCKTMVSFVYDLSKQNMQREERTIRYAKQKYRFRQGDFSDLHREFAIYTDLNNRCFESHEFYYVRDPAEDYELFKSFGLFLKPENFIVAMKGDMPIGFLLWYPDFHELMHPGKTIGLGTLLKYRLPGNQINRFKIAEFGVLPSYHGSAVIGGLIDAAITAGLKNGHRVVESGWILADNDRSRRICSRWADTPYKRYKVFEIHREERR